MQQIHSLMTGLEKTVSHSQKVNSTHILIYALLDTLVHVVKASVNTQQMLDMFPKPNKLPCAFPNHG